MRSPHKVAKVLLAFIVCSTIDADYWTYSRMEHASPDAWGSLIRGTAFAPEQYRIGVLLTADLMRRHGHMGMRHALTLIDLVCAAVAVFLLYSVFERSRIYRAASETARWFGAAVFVTLTQYFLAWTTWYQRPETMANLAVLAATLWLLTVRLPLPSVASILVTSTAMLALAAMQGFIRADVIFACHLGVFLVCLTRAGDGFSLPRWAQAATSVMAVLVAGGIQVYLMHVVYPQAHYGITPIMLRQNLTGPMGMIPFILFMMPLAWLTITLVRRRPTAEAPSIALAIGSAIYLIIWAVMGRIEEVRIFLPYAVALVPLTCMVAMQQFVGAKDEREARA